MSFSDHIIIPSSFLFSLQGRTPLRVALLEGSLDIAGLLLDNGADIDYVDTDSRSSLYIMALENDVKTVEFLLNHGANTELKDCDGRTGLHVAAWQGYTDIVQVRGNGFSLKNKMQIKKLSKSTSLKPIGRKLN